MITEHIHCWIMKLAYGFDVKSMTEGSCVAELMRMYQKLAGDQ